MKYFALLVLFLFGASLSAQEMPKAPEIPFRVVDDFLKIPSDMIMAEAVGVAINSKGHIFILNRGNHPLLEFSADGDFIGSFGEGSPIFRVPHSIRFDSQDNLWYVNSGDNLVVKFNPRRRVEQALGRREEPWVYLTHGIERAIPPPASFYQPTDTVVGPDGSTYVTDGYGNSRVVKFSKEGNLVKYWGDRGTRPGQFNTPHNIVIDTKSNLYVADRQNNRVQVFSPDGDFLTQWRDLARPCDIYIDHQGVVYVPELDGLMTLLNLDGQVLTRWLSPTSTSTGDGGHAVWLDSHGDIYINQNQEGRRLLKYRRCS